MPELPDVEGFRQVLESCAKGRVVRHVEVRDAGVLHGVGVRGLRDALEGRRFGTPERHGKWLLARTGGPTLVLHFGMTGRLVCGRPDDAVEAGTPGPCGPAAAGARSCPPPACGRRR
ncbi:Formamidopyrimidine-DNA glycosylase [Streptomyces violarus]